MEIERKEIQKQICRSRDTYQDTKRLVGVKNTALQVMMSY